MSEKKAIEEIVYSALDELGNRMTELPPIKRDRSTVLFATGGFLDSLGLVNLVVLLEEKIENELGVSITLADEKALSQETSPFQTIGALIDYIKASCPPG